MPNQEARDALFFQTLWKDYSKIFWKYKMKSLNPSVQISSPHNLVVRSDVKFSSNNFESNSCTMQPTELKQSLLDSGHHTVETRTMVLAQSFRSQHKILRVQNLFNLLLLCIWCFCLLPQSQVKIFIWNPWLHFHSVGKNPTRPLKCQETSFPMLKKQLKYWIQLLIKFISNNWLLKCSSHSSVLPSAHD